MDTINKIINDYQDTPDLISRKIKYKFNYIYLFYIETICSSDRVDSFILRNLTNLNRLSSLNKVLSAPNIKNISDSEVEFYLNSGFTILVYKKDIYALETRADLDRSVNTPQIEPDLYGAKDALVENYQKNIGLIKRRIKSKHLKTKEFKLGRYTKTSSGLLYIDNIANSNLVKNCENILSNIDTESIIDAGELEQFLVRDEKNFFPSTKLTERPDAIVHALLEGKIVIVVDTSPFAIIIPAVLADFINPVSDNYIHSNNVNFIKILRLVCFFVTILTPAYYIAIINYNQETIPDKLLTSFITQREGVPFPATLEAFFMLLICEILRESDIRFPNSYGSSISVLGALILGEAAVSASIVSPIMIIIIALTYISSMIFSNVEMTAALRSWRFICLIIASIYGLYGLALSFILLVINLCSYYSFSIPYSFPVAPFNFSYLKDTLIKIKRKNDTKRSEFLTNNIRKQKNL